MNSSTSRFAVSGGRRLAPALFAAALLSAAIGAHAQSAAPPEAGRPAAAEPVPEPPAPATAPADAGTEPAAAAADNSAAFAPGKVQEIVITATRREAALSKVPVSVSAFTQETMDQKGIKDFSDVARFTPGVTIDTNGTNAISIRGISSSGGSGTTGIYIDDTPIQMRALGFNPDDALPKTFDLERVEVLRGPQGTLFGAGSEGGTVRYLMAQPSLSKTSLYVRSEVSTTRSGDPSYEIGVAGGAPLIDGKLGVRASVWYRHDGGWVDRIDPYTLATVEKNANYDDTIAMRLAAKWAVTPQITVSPSIVYQDRERNDITAYWPIYSDPGSHVFRNADPERRNEPDHYFLPALKVEADIGDWASLISNTSYYSRKDLSGYNGTEYNLGYYQTFSWSVPFVNPSYYPLIDANGLHLPNGFQYHAPAQVQNSQQTLSQEIRLQSSDPGARLSWTAGIFFAENRQISIEEINDPMLDSLFQLLFGLPQQQVFVGDGAAVPENLLPNGDSYFNYNFSKDRQLAGFGELTYGITDRLKLTAGLRYAKTDVSFYHDSDGPQNFVGAIIGSGQQHDKPFTPKLGVSFQMDRNNLFYATFAKGYRIGGADAPIPTSACLPDLQNLGLSAAPDHYASDTVLSYELGAKNKLLDSLRIASSLYYIKWKSIQQTIYLPGCGFQFTTNTGDAIAKGFDLQAEWSPADALTVEAAIGFTDARYAAPFQPSPSAAPFVMGGNAIIGESGTPNPPWTVTVGAQYNFSALAHKSFVRLDYEFQSHNTWLTPAQDPATGQYDPAALTPAATSFISMRAGTTIDKWNIAAFVDNLFDVHPELLPSSYPHSDADGYAPPGQAGTLLLRRYTFRPRTIGISTSYHF